MMDSSKNELHIQFLGGFAVSAGDRTIPEAQWKLRRSSSLVKLLALAPGHRLHRDQIINALWPDSDLSSAANNFYQTLYAARRILDPLAPGCLRLEEGFLRLAAGEGQALVVDVEQFEAAAAETKDCQDPAVFQSALELYPGDLLPDDLYETWTIQRREALHQMYLSLLLALARLYETQAEYPEGIAVLQRLLRADRSHEEAHAGLMRLYARSGLRQQALRQFQALRQALQEELDTEPGQTTRQLYDAIQSGRPDLAAQSIPTILNGSTKRANQILPGGTVTFLFTDIQGSTPLWEQVPEAMRSAVARHNALLREAIAGNGGVVYKVIGDQFQAAFPYVYQGVAAAVAAQRALLAETWPGLPGPIRVRMGLHTGPAEIEGNDYAVSHTLNRAARVMSAGSGGEILLSQETAALARSDLAAHRLPQGINLRDLGEQQLRGLEIPERLYQVVAPGLPDSFSHQPSARTHPNNLPAQLTSFIGRETQIAEVRQRVRRHRLVTLTGAGGTGKTRLALKAAEGLVEAFPGGAFLVELAPVSDPGLLPQAVAQTLELIEQPGISLPDLLAHYLEKKHLLLILDNCEHILDACTKLVDRLVKACHHLHILTTSREILSVAGESAFRVPSLNFPLTTEKGSLAELAQNEAVRLFVERAGLVSPEFTLTEANAGTVAQICRRLDGIPLALELAAGRVRVMSVEQIAARLDDLFRLLTGGSRSALPRQQTLKATLDWSYQLLSKKERLLFQRLSVFAGGWDLEAAEQVAAEAAEADADGAGQDRIEAWEVLDLLTVLVDKSLVYPIAQGGRVRYSMPEIIRQYAREKLANEKLALDQILASGGSQAIRDRHLAYYARLTDEAEPHLRGKGQLDWLACLDDELDNLRAAMEWARTGKIEQGLQIAADLFWYWHIRGSFTERTEWLKTLLEAETRGRTKTNFYGERTFQRARALRAYQFYAFYDNHLTQAEQTAILQESITILRQAGPRGRRELGISLFCLLNMGSLDQPSPEREEMLAILNQEQERFYLSEYYFILSYDYTNHGEVDRSKAALEASLDICREIEDIDGIASHTAEFSGHALWAGDYQRAETLINESIEYSRKVKNRVLEANCHKRLIWLAIAQGNYAEVNRMAERIFSILREFNYLPGIMDMHFMLLQSAWSQGDYPRVMNLASEITERYADNVNLHQDAYFYAGRAALSQNDLSQAEALLKKALEFKGWKTLNKERLLLGWISLFIKQGKAEQAARLMATLDWIYQRTAAGLSPRERSEHDEALSAARSSLGDTAFEQAWKAGQAMTLDLAIEFVLAEIG